MRQAGDPMDGPPKLGKVVNLRRNPAYKPDLAALAREQVVAGRRKLGLSQKEFAELLSPLLGWAPTAEIIEGWETTAVPPGDVILAIGMAAHDTGQDVLTVALTAEAERVADLVPGVIGDLNRVLGAPDVTRAYETRGMITRSQWNGIIEDCQRHVWLYGMAELGYALDDAVPGLLHTAAANGCDIRVLLLDPSYSGTSDIDVDEGNPPGTLSPRIRAARIRFGQMMARCDGRMQIRVYNAPPTVSIVRGDDRMLVTPYLRFFVGGNSPTFELEDIPDGKMFDRYCRHFETVWQIAKEWTP
jgi:hypothetical protein